MSAVLVRNGRSRRNNKSLLVRAALVVGLAAFLGSCSFVRMAYDGAPWLIMRNVDNYLDLDGVQEDALQDALETYFSSHRDKQLPGIVELLREMRDRAGDNMSEADWEWAFSEVRAS